MAVSMIGPKFHAWDADGKPLAGGKVYTYALGTNIPKATYTGEDALVENSNPVILNPAGWADIYLDGSYSVEVYDKDNNLIWDEPEVSAAGQRASEWVDSRTATQVSASSFSVVGNHTATYVEGRALRLQDASVIYGYVDSVSYTAGNTQVVVIADDPLTASLQSVAVSVLSADSQSLNNSKIAWYADLAEVLGLTSLKDGSYVGIVNRNNTRAGGGNVYRVHGPGSGTHDNGSWIDHPNTGKQLKGMFPNGINAEQFGAIGDGSAVDTAAMQAFWNYAPEAKLTAGKEYLCANLLIPNKKNWVLDLNGAELKRSSGGDLTYFIAAYKHVNNIAEAQHPVRIKHNNGVINCDGYCDYGLIIQNWNSLIEAEVKGALKDGVVLSAQTMNGTSFPESSLVNSRFRLISHHNGGCGFIARDPLRNNATDGYILPGSYFYANGDYGVVLEAGAGWDVQCNTYANGGGVFWKSYGRGSRLHDSYIDDGNETVSALPTTGETRSYAVLVNNSLSAGNGLLNICDNELKGPVYGVGNGDTAPYMFRSKNNNYTGRASGAVEAYIKHGFYGVSRKIWSAGDTFMTSDPFRFEVGDSPGEIIVDNAYVVSLDRFLDGRISGATKGEYVSRAELPKPLRTRNAVSVEAGQITAGAAFSFDVPVILSSYSQKFMDVRLQTRNNWDGAVRVDYVGNAVITSKQNSEDAWRVSLTNIVNDPTDWTTPIAVSVTDNGDGTGTVTITGDPADADGHGRMLVTLG